MKGACYELFEIEGAMAWFLIPCFGASCVGDFWDELKCYVICVNSYASLIGFYKVVMGIKL